jgi:hypothetical protein
MAGLINIGNGTIYGHVFTGPGTTQSAVTNGPNGAIGDINWNATSSGIEPGYWAGNFNTAIPDVPAPTFAGMALPSPTNGMIVLNGGNYAAPSGGPTSPLVITAPTVLWVQGSFSPTGITFTNGGSLILYVGTTFGSGDSFTCGSFNSPGYAANFQILGLPSLTSITLNGNDNMVAAIYAPEANFSATAGGSSGDTSGALVVNTVILRGHINFHYDESLQVTGPFH